MIDFDHVEPKNVKAQFHGLQAVGKNKALALQQLMKFVFGVKANAVPHRLTADNDVQLLTGSDLILDCLDRPEPRLLVQQVARRFRIPCLHGALAADGAFGRVVWDEQFVVEPAASGGATCEDGEHEEFIFMVSGHLAYAAKVFFRDGRRLGWQIPATGDAIPI